MYKNGSMRLIIHTFKKDYAIMQRLNDNSFIVVWNLQINPDDNTCLWSQGYYDLTLETAKKLLSKKTK